LTSDVVRKQLGPNIFEAANEYRLTSWLAQQEDRNIITLYQCDSSLSAWTHRCMRQADVILIVGLGDRSYLVGKFEREIDRLAMRTQKELVLLYHASRFHHPDDARGLAGQSSGTGSIALDRHAPGAILSGGQSA